MASFPTIAFPRGAIFSTVLLLGLVSSSASAQVVPDATLPQNSIVTVEGNTFTIDGGTQLEGNLFHSFDRFDIPTGNAAFFNNAIEIGNIFTRVTGESISNIDGTLGSNGGANLFLINPNGFIFGENASLNIGGSFFVSSADSVIFANGFEFSATDPQRANSRSLLEINVPIGLQFGENPGVIVNRSRAIVPGAVPELPPPLTLPETVGLSVAPGRVIGVIGGDIAVESGIFTSFQGQIHLGSVGGSGLVGVMPTATGVVFDYSTASTFGNIDIANGSFLNAIGLGGGRVELRGDVVNLTSSSQIVANTVADFDGRGVDIEAGEFNLSDRAFISTSTFGNGRGGDINIRANDANLVGTTPFEFTAQLVDGTFDPIDIRDGLYAMSLGAGTGGNIDLNIDRLRVADGIGIFTLTVFSGQGGNLNLVSSESIALQNGSLLITGSAGDGNAGNITIETPTLQISGGTSVSTTPAATSRGNGGDIFVRTQLLEMTSTPAGSPTPGGLFSVSLGFGDSGDTIVETDRAIARGGTQISAAASGAGEGGNLRVTANSIDIGGVSADGVFLTGLFTSSSLLTVRGQTGNAGAGVLTVDTQRLTVRDGAQISSATGGEGRAGSTIVRAVDSIEVIGVGTGADPAVEAVSFGIIGDGIIPSSIESNARGIGQAGDLIIETDRLTVRDGAEVGVRATGAGSAGNLNVTANQVLVDRGGGISGTTESGAGGNVTIAAPDLRLRRGSAIATNAGNTDGGNITIESDTLVALENSDITANALEGRGGRVSIAAEGIFGTQFRAVQTPESDITATSALGPQFSGVVEIQTPDTDPSSALVVLSAETIDADDRIVSGCSAHGSNFAVTGRGGLPHNPTVGLYGDRPWGDDRDWRSLISDPLSRSVGDNRANAVRPYRLTEATQWEIEGETVRLLAGRSRSFPVECQQ